MYYSLNNLDTHTGIGPDNIASVFLKFCNLVLVWPLHLMFNKSLRLDYFPSIWKKYFIASILKSGYKHNVTSYRLIF